MEYRLPCRISATFGLAAQLLTAVACSDAAIIDPADDVRALDERPVRGPHSDEPAIQEPALDAVEEPSGGLTAGEPTPKAPPVTFSSQTTVIVVRLQGTAIVDPNGNRHQQAVVDVAVGDTIEFVNLDNTSHTATSSANPAGGSPFNSGTLSLNGRFRFVPDAVGAWTFFCRLHPTIMPGATINAS